MTSVFILHPNDLKNKMIFLNYININESSLYNFLDIIKVKYDIDINVYYLIIKSIEEFKLKNILYFINLRLKKINKKINYEKVTYDNINCILNDFINNDEVNCIIIMNLIQQYIYPIRLNS